MSDDREPPKLIKPDIQHKAISRGDWETDDLVDTIEMIVNRINERRPCLYFMVRYSRRAVWVGGWERKPSLPDLPDLDCVDLQENAA